MFPHVFKEDFWDVKEFGRRCGMMIRVKFIVEKVKLNSRLKKKKKIILKYVIIPDIFNHI